MNLPDILLQTTRWQGLGGQQASNTPAYIGIGIAFGLVILIVVISRVVASGKKQGSQRKYRPAMFRKEGKKIGLEDRHINLLEDLVKKYNVNYPYNLYMNTPLLDQTLARGFQDLAESSAAEDQKNIQKSAMFRIKQIIEMRAQKKKTLSSTKQLKINQALILAPASGGRYRSKVISVMNEAISVEAPQGVDGNLIIKKRWQQLSVFFWKEAGTAYTFKTKVVGFKPAGSMQTLLLQHARNVELSQHRRYRRKSVDRPAYYYRVNVVESGRGRKLKKEAVVDTQYRGLGTLIDISSGGCSIKAKTPLQKGELVKIQFEPVKRHSITAFGKVRHISRIKPVGSIMHIMFTKISRQHLNSINEYIYEFTEEKSS
ncbi:MAG: PilZ domain-containing protein [Spirochaetales bacterium]|nr:MAG: PilZ domain-containing protein [Spirochaetales bacterium]